MSLGVILEHRPTVDQVEVLLLVGNLELAQRLGHQVCNTKAIQFMLLHLVVSSIELGGMFLDSRPPFCEQGLTPVAHKRVITQMLMLMEEDVFFQNVPPLC
jgi:hypothetical protein